MKYTCCGRTFKGKLGLTMHRLKSPVHTEQPRIERISAAEDKGAFESKGNIVSQVNALRLALQAIQEASVKIEAALENVQYLLGKLE